MRGMGVCFQQGIKPLSAGRWVLAFLPCLCGARRQAERPKNPDNPVNPVKKYFEFQKAKPIPT
jgi:hypothetical protein